MDSTAGNGKVIDAPPERLARPTTQDSMLAQKQENSWRKWLVIFTLILSDILLAVLMWGLALVLHGIWRHGEALFIGPVAGYVVTSTATWIGLRALLGLYPGYGLSSAEELRRQTFATVATLGITLIFAFGFQAGDLLPRLLVALSFLECLLRAPLGRHFVKWGLAKFGLWGKPVVILGAGETGKQLVQTLKEEWGLGLRPVAVFDFRLASRGRVLEDIPYGGTVVDAMDLAWKQRIDTAIFAMPHVRRKYVDKFVDKASSYFRYVLVVPEVGGVMNTAVTAKDLAGATGLEIKHNLLDPWAQRAKRALDLFGVVVGGLLISPLLLLIVTLIKLDSRGPTFYKQLRLGAGGKYFYCWKFRTMRAEADRLLTELLQNDPKLRTDWERNHKLHDDPRITRIGRLLRRTSLDELPQLWNVLRGEMSLVGPRPIVNTETSKYKAAYELYRRVRPGMTGLWQVSGRNAISYEERIEKDVYYVRNWSVWVDFIILARTVGAVIRGHGAT